MVRLYVPQLPFLYPCLDQTPLRLNRTFRSSLASTESSVSKTSKRSNSTESTLDIGQLKDGLLSASHLNPPPTDYGRTIFADKANLTLLAGSGGHGCISFLREKFIEHGPANGGDGGTGGSIYIQAVRGETSLHKLARRSIISAGRGKNGQGGSKGGKRGEDVLLQVPVGTVIRETARVDPVAEEEEQKKLDQGGSDLWMETEGDVETKGTWRRDKWVLYPSAAPGEYARAEFPPLPRSRKSGLASTQPEAPISLDLSEPMDRPMLLTAGAAGGLGNPHFVSRNMSRPKFATKGEKGMSVTLELELKLLADVGFVGMPNAGKSTLLRALSKSRARVGDWAFTTLQPNIGTVVLDNNHGRAQLQASHASGEPRRHISIADIPGLITDAHQDKGLGLGFLRHIERAQVLAFVVDLSNGSAIDQLKLLWRELGEFENLKGQETNTQTESRIVGWQPLGSPRSTASASQEAGGLKNKTMIIEPAPSLKLPALPMAPISSKPWFVVATKADTEGTRENFKELQAYLVAVASGSLEHPSGRKNARRDKLAAIPVSAIRGEGVDKIPEWTVGLLED